MRLFAYIIGALCATNALLTSIGNWRQDDPVKDAKVQRYMALAALWFICGNTEEP